MKKIEVFGTGCKKCITTENMIKQKALEIGVEIDILHISDAIEIASRGIIRTPAIMIDGKLVHSSGVPDDLEIEQWLRQ